MRRLAYVLLACALLLSAASVQADDPAHAELGARLNLALTVGAIERGTRASDLTYGAPQLVLDAAYVLSRVVSVGVLLGYGAAIPKLCASAADCVSSLGRDLTLAVLVRFHAPRLAWIQPDLEVGAGHAWSSRALSDRGERSTHSYRGPLLYLGFAPTFVLGGFWSFSAVVGAQLGIAERVQLEAPGVSQSRSPFGTRVYGSMNIGARIGARL